MPHILYVILKQRQDRVSDLLQDVSIIRPLVAVGADSSPTPDLCLALTRSHGREKKTEIRAQNLIEAEWRHYLRSLCVFCTASSLCLIAFSTLDNCISIVLFHWCRFLAFFLRSIVVNCPGNTNA